LNVPETFNTNGRPRTPRQVVPWRDVAETCRTLDAVCSMIPAQRPPLRIVDGIARSGFWGAVFRERWPTCRLVLNEEDAGCRDILQSNFPRDTVLSHDIHEWAPAPCDLILLDFDHFTLRILDQWRGVLERYAPLCRYFIIADGACFGWKFGNLKHYGLTDENEYFRLLDRTMSAFIDKRITAVSQFCNASTILLESKTVHDITFLPPSMLPLRRGTKAYGEKKTVASWGLGI